MGSLRQPHQPQEQLAPQEGFRLDPRIDAATTRAPAASREDSRSQAILKLHHPSNLDYRARHKILVRVGLCGSEGNIYICNLIFFQWFISENCEE